MSNQTKAPINVLLVDEGQFQATFEKAPLGIGLIDRHGRLFSINPALRAMLGEDPGPDATLADYVHADDRQRFVDLTCLLLSGAHADRSLEARFVPRSGFFSCGRINVSLVRSDDQQPRFAVCMIEDITGRKAGEDQSRLAAKVLEATSEGIFVTDIGLHIIHVNPSFSRLTGFDAADVLGHKPSVLASGRHGPEFYATMWKAIQKDGIWRGEIWDRKKSGDLFVIWLNISVVKNEHGAISHYFALFSDITSRKLSEERLNHLANHDVLTGLPNRALFLERLSRTLVRAQRNKLVFALLFLDLDQFKQINDNLGHIVGDTLLREVAERLSATVRRQDTVARLGGDEFVLIIEDINDFRDAATVAQKILGQFAPTFLLNGQPTRVSASVGISLFPGNGTDPATLLREADEAMYCAKKQGRASFRFASADLSEKAFERDTLRKALFQALDDEGLDIFYQPIVDLRTNRILSVEALLRWHHPTVGLMVPGQFLPLAIESGLMPSIGRWGLETAIRQLSLWRRNGHPDLRLCVNVNKYELHAADFVRQLHDILSKHGVPAASLDIEIPETIVTDNAPETVPIIKRLHEMQCRVALDDFGAGRTDFRALRQVPVDSLKIAPDFIRGLPGNHDEAKLVNAVIVVAHSLRITVVAKAVETCDQYTFLHQHHCDAAQGYLFSRPVPWHEFPPPVDVAALAEYSPG
ncbi:MAG TPA: EAL domain-containing protein [Telmatospirillum sp.]|nr:EAL domain-containing protein [Telmatospirillum sp.]